MCDMVRICGFMREVVMERRGSERVCARLPVEAEREGKAVVVDLETVDLSVVGLAVESATSRPTAARFEWLAVSRPGEAPVRILAERAGATADAETRSEAARAAYRIKYIFPRDRRRYEAFVATRLAQA
jgi:hypothetical protein